MTDDLKSRLNALRSEMSAVNRQMLANLNDYFAIAHQIGEVKEKLGLTFFDPARESEMLDELMLANPGPMPSHVLKHLFKEVFNASIEQMGFATKQKLKVQRPPGAADAVIQVLDVAIGGPRKVIMAGPCSVENRDQMFATAEKLASHGVKILRGGAFKPRTSPYSFQGLEEEGLKLLREAADAFGMAVITEVMRISDLELVARYADILQIGTRNMFNYPLLKEAGKASKPVFLKRGFMATLEEFLLAAEYVHLGGNARIILCERGIRTFETWTRNTLDISAVPILKKETPLPVIVDVSHALGRKDVLLPICRACLAAGADGLMIEAHHNPQIALSDCSQQLNLEEMDQVFPALKDMLGPDDVT